MNASGFGFSLAFALATGAAAHRDRPNVALRDFVPPALLHGGPDFLDSAIFAAERSILIVAALDEIRDTIAVVVSQQGGRHGFSTYRAVDRSSVDAADLDLPFSATEPVRLDFLTALLVAFHRGSVMVPGLRSETLGSGFITTRRPSTTRERAHSAAPALGAELASARGLPPGASVRL